MLSSTMWAEIIISRDDLARLLVRALPLKIHLGDPGSEHALDLSDPGLVSLVPGLGLRVECKARVHWPVVGIDVPIGLSSLRVLLLPSVARRPEGDTLVFRLSIEHADFSALPGMLDTRVTEAINAKLASPAAELAWNFTKSLTHSVALPSLLEPLDRLAFRPAWGKVRVTQEAVVYAISFHTAVVRLGEAVPTEFDATTAPVTRPPVSGVARRGAIQPRGLTLDPTQLAKVGFFGLGMGLAYFALKASFTPRSPILRLLDEL
jgi:hypothetical protein